MTEELKSCPICGAAARIAFDSGNEVWNQSCRVKCSGCWMQTPKTYGSSSWRTVKKEDDKAKAEAISAWNRRAPAQPEPAAPPSALDRFLAVAEEAGFKTIHDIPGLIPALEAAPTKEWCMNMARLEVGHDVDAGLAAAPTVVAPADTMDALAAAADLVDAMAQRETKGSALALVLRYRKACFAECATPPRAAVPLDAELIRALALEHSSASFGRENDDGSIGGWMFDYDDLIVFVRAIEAAITGGPRNE